MSHGLLLSTLLNVFFDDVDLPLLYGLTDLVYVRSILAEICRVFAGIECVQ